MSKSDKHYCHSRDKQISVVVGFEKCIKENQCFSDDPCPLQERFDALPKLKQAASPQSVQKFGSESVPNFV
jgi:hypothetical protein